MTDLLPAVWAALGGAPAALRRATTTGPAVTLASTFPVTALGAATVAASLLAATSGTGARVGVDTRQLAVALRSERYLRRDGRSPGSPFDPGPRLTPRTHLVDSAHRFGGVRGVPQVCASASESGAALRRPAGAPSFGTAAPCWDGA